MDTNKVSLQVQQTQVISHVSADLNSGIISAYEKIQYQEPAQVHMSMRDVTRSREGFGIASFSVRLDVMQMY